MNKDVSLVFEGVVNNAMKIVKDNKFEIKKFEVIKQIGDIFKNVKTEVR